MHLGLQGCAFPSGAVVTAYFTVHGSVFPSLMTIRSHFKGQHTIKIWMESIHFTGRDSIVGIATGYGLGGTGIESQWGAQVPAPVQTGPGAHPASYMMGAGSFPGVKRPGDGVDHPPPPSAQV